MNINIAIVDDNLFLISTVKEKLSFFKEFTIKLTAINGSELLAKMDGHHNLDLILMDIEMPVLNGIDNHRNHQKKISSDKNYYAHGFR